MVVGGQGGGGDTTKRFELAVWVTGYVQLGQVGNNWYTNAMLGPPFLINVNTSCACWFFKVSGMCVSGGDLLVPLM